jgi:two-component system LytT family response regulator
VLLAEHRDTGVALTSTHDLRADVLIVDVDPRRPEVLRMLRALPAPVRPRLLLVSGAHEDAVQAFDLGAVDFLVSPIEPTRFRQALARVRAAMAVDRLRVSHAHAVARLGDVLALLADDPVAPDAAPMPSPAPIGLRSGRRTVTLAAHAIRWISVRKNDVTVHGDTGAITARLTLADLLAQLDAASFVRTHRSVVVNVERVRELRRTHGGAAVLTLDDGTEVPVSRTHRRALARALAQPAARRPSDRAHAWTLAHEVGRSPRASVRPLGDATGARRPAVGRQSRGGDAAPSRQ